ncbi:MAG TPA: DNA mismatch repair endonuclease MutL, partial [Gammaproteobacteria bacterium]|nr:DNA mismatch repair endonuclease MutL [Gammaproteobacteria bacterium]
MDPARSTTIRRLDDRLINQIAAGEVIERPSSVVKELMENALDAGASEIQVVIERGGVKQISVTDNGYGMSDEDLVLSVSRHATSKIAEFDDLSRVTSLGFRGEALPSIASVSRLTINSRSSSEDSGWKLSGLGGDFDEPRPVSGPIGTRVTMEDLFFNTPVRRKFLRTERTEKAHIERVIKCLALARPQTGFSLTADGRRSFSVPVEATPDQPQRVESILGRVFSENSIRVDSEANGMTLLGWLGSPAFSRSQSDMQYCFVNGRAVKDVSLSHAVRRAFSDVMYRGRQPAYVLYLRVPPDTVDVNVHPTKSEVRFQDSQQLYRQLLSVIRTTFLGLPLETSLRVDPSGPVSHHARGPADPHQRHLSIDPSRGPHRPFSPHVSSPAVSGSSGPGFPSAGNTTVSVNGPSSSPGGSSPVSSTAESTSPETTTDEGVRALQIHDCYLVLETPEGMTVVDQHALHERILYEQFKQRMLDGEIEQQKLLVPETVELSSREAALVTEHADLLAKLGFGIESFGHNTVVVNSYPSRLRGLNFSELLQDLSDRLEQPEKAPGRRDILDSLLQMMACKA